MSSSNDKLRRRIKTSESYSVANRPTGRGGGNRQKKYKDPFEMKNRRAWLNSFEPLDRLVLNLDVNNDCHVLSHFPFLDHWPYPNYLCTTLGIPCFPLWSFLLYHFNHLVAWFIHGSTESSLPCLFFGRISASLLYIIHQLLLEIHTNITLMNLLNTQKMPWSEIFLCQPDKGSLGRKLMGDIISIWLKSRQRRQNDH